VAGVPNSGAKHRIQHGAWGKAPGTAGAGPSMLGVCRMAMTRPDRHLLRALPGAAVDHSGGEMGGQTGSRASAKGSSLGNQRGPGGAMRERHPRGSEGAVRGSKGGSM